MQKVPVRLTKDPILEAVFELRFQGSVPAVAEVLQSYIYPAFKDRFPALQRTPLSGMPLALLESDLQLRYQPRLVLQGKNSAIFIGDHVVAISCARPYIGWSQFAPLIFELLKYVHQASVMVAPERFALKYVNMLSGDSPTAQFQSVQFESMLGNRDLKQQTTHVRTEFEEDGFTNVIELTANSTVKLPNAEPLNGIVFTIDTIKQRNLEDFLVNPQPDIERAHTVEKAVFFGILTPTATQEMGPVY